MRRACFLLAGLAVGCFGWNLTVDGVSSLTNAAFATLLPASRGERSAALFVSQFTGNPFGKDAVSIIPSVGLDFPSSGGNWSQDAVPVELLSNITWPNTIHPADPSLGSEFGYLIAGGFLVPPKTVGAVHYVSLAPSSSLPSVDAFVKLSTDKGNSLLDGWFYHMAISVDMNGDGLEDVLTARATKPLLGQSQGEMLWLQRPSGADPLGPASVPWQEVSLYSGEYAPDVFFCLSDLDGNGAFEIVYVTYFSEGGGSFSVLHTGTDTSPQRWSKSVQRVTVDTSLGTMFGVSATDLNADGRVDFLVTNHVDNATLSGVFAFVPPADGNFTDPGKWAVHTLASGFPTRVPGPGQAAPGQALAVRPGAGAKPVVLVSGDGEEQFHLLQPLSESPQDWGYSRSVVYDCGGTVGAPAAADLNGDGTVEVILPCYDANQLVAFSFA
jgi:hypothetical protein